MNVHTPYTSSLGPCWEAAWRLGRDWRRCSRGPRVNNGVGDAVVHAGRG